MPQHFFLYLTYLRKYKYFTNPWDTISVMNSNNDKIWLKHDKTDSLVSVGQNSSNMAQHILLYLAYLRKYKYFTNPWDTISVMNSNSPIKKGARLRRVWHLFFLDSSLNFEQFFLKKVPYIKKENGMVFSWQLPQHYQFCRNGAHS